MIIHLTRYLTALAAQMGVPAIRSCAQRDDHVQRMVSWLSDALQKRSADLVVLPELCTIDYARHECLRWITIDRQLIAEVRGKYPFLKDRLSDYR